MVVGGARLLEQPSQVFFPLIVVEHYIGIFLDSLPDSVLLSPLRRRWFAVRGVLYKNTLARNSWCSRRRRVIEVDISTPVAVDQRAANCLEEAIRSFTAIRSRC
ncbi:uncharacterized protein TNCV_595291 [Trichonephila clavipes]|nr:uncharacterized protein TNCV_595291 [Trichonephila clavipes]